MIDPLMTTHDRWLLPEGIDELLPRQAEHLEGLRRRLLDVFHSWGYELVMPPFIEYLESLLVGTGYDLDLQTFKLTDQLSGRLLGVRADMTPQVARIDAHRLKHNGPTRLCYLGVVLRTRPDGFARTRAPFQVGAELYGHDGMESEAEILHLMVETLRQVGLDQVYIDLGHVGIFRGLAAEAGLDEAQEASLFSALQRKAKPEIEAFLQGLDLAPEYRRMLVELVDLNGTQEVLAEAADSLRQAGSIVQASLAELRRVAEFAAIHMPGIPLHFDLAELRGYHYQTGIVFAAFIPGHGQEIARGGRYNDIGKAFGRARPATGFSTDLRTLITLNPPEPATQQGILAPWQDEPSLHAEVKALRDQGERVIYQLPGTSEVPQELGCDRVLKPHGQGWQVVPADSPETR